MKTPNLKELKANGWYNERDLRMTAQMMRSEAFILLTHTSKYVLQLFLSRREWHYEGKSRRKKPIYHNTGLKFPYSEAEAYGIGKKQFRRCIIELIEHGFLEIAKEGGQLHGHRTCSEYNLIDDWKHYGTPEFVPRTASRGVCYSNSLAKYNQDRKTKKAQAADDDETVIECHGRQPISCHGRQPKHKNAAVDGGHG